LQGLAPIATLEAGKNRVPEHMSGTKFD